MTDENKVKPHRTTTTKQSISSARQRLLELMQELRFGQIEGLDVRDGEPVLEPGPRVVRDIVFGKDNAPHQALGQRDFILRFQVIELFDFFDQERSFQVERLVVNNGLPVRMTVAGMARTG